jgi:molybdopterin converting factor small subunit
MSVEIHLHPFLSDQIDNRDIIKTTGRSTGECIAQLIAQYPALHDYIFYKDGTLQTFIEIYVNLKTAGPNELEWPVNDGDRIDIMMTVAGG